jgi:hypothetical protein
MIGQTLMGVFVVDGHLLYTLIRFLVPVVILGLYAFYRIRRDSAQVDYLELLKLLSQHPNDDKLRMQVVKAGRRFYRQQHGRCQADLIVQNDIAKIQCRYKSVR